MILAPDTRRMNSTRGGLNKLCFTKIIETTLLNYESVILAYPTGAFFSDFPAQMHYDIFSKSILVVVIPCRRNGVLNLNNQLIQHFRVAVFFFIIFIGGIIPC